MMFFFLMIICLSFTPAPQWPAALTFLRWSKPFLDFKLVAES